MDVWLRCVNEENEKEKKIQLNENSALWFEYLLDVCFAYGDNLHVEWGSSTLPFYFNLYTRWMSLLFFVNIIIIIAYASSADNVHTYECECDIRRRALKIENLFGLIKFACESFLTLYLVIELNFAVVPFLFSYEDLI